MPSVNVQFVEPGSQFQGKITEKPLLRFQNEEIENELVVYFVQGERGHHRVSEWDGDSRLDSKIIIDPQALSYTSLRYLYDREGRPMMAKGGVHKCFVNSHGYFDRGGGKYGIRTRGDIFFVGKERLLEQHAIRARKEADKAFKEKVAERREEALQQHGEAVRAGDWAVTRFWDFGISFPDYSYLTWPTEVECSFMIRPSTGPKRSLAEQWGGWRPDEPLDPENAPSRYRDRIKRGIAMLKKVTVDSLRLLPEKEEKSPVIKLEGENAVRIYRTIDVPKNVQV